ncbi:phospholipid/cholesterol/gamma-HCH transport system substrate-binding protein [Balneicella halophila]|uniref:Phospholipid/cholesterol/gamma-HCH transport system substrate-binding protein n=1 Tax=Balneicella halophila TaxID=1537566 RepID=A0A7L4URH1_BALHA|nr:MlaD family protein [Balneicella halophila]PVX52259.1 phospholipid/cholesterol/gamma-HCH transport system substrate-binding protein [Balneicella halophila]
MKKNVITGIVVVVALVLFFFGFNFLKGKNIFFSDNIFHAIYTHVDGLKKSSKVTIRGYKVGEVQEVAFTSERADLLMVSFSVSSDYKIPKGTIAQIITTDIMGSRSLELRLPPEAEFGYLVSGDTLDGGMSKGLKEEVSAQVRPLKAKAQELMGSLDSILNATQAVLGKDSQRSLIASIENMEKTFRNLKNATGSLEEVMTGEEQNMRSILQNLSDITQNLNQNQDRINRILSNVSSFTDTLAQADFTGTLLEAQTAIKQFTGLVRKIEAGEGTVGALLNDKQLYDELETAAASLGRLTTDLRMNPKKYVQFSLLNTGRTVYCEGQGPNSSDKIYRIQLYHSSTPVNLNNPIFKGRDDVMQIQNKKGDYLYTIGYTSDYEQLQDILKKLRKDFPDAFIIEDKQ